MCGRYASSANRDQLVEEFEIDEVVDAPGEPNYNIAPTDPVTGVVERADAESGDIVRKLVSLRWGLVPSWSKNANGGARMINARAETVAEKPAFRKAFAARRCLLPADGYFEWYATDHPGAANAKGQRKPKKQPFFIRRDDHELLAMAGIYEFWRDDSKPHGDPLAWVVSCSVITTTATDRLGHIHDRMPMVVSRDHWKRWLDPTHTDPGKALELLSVTEAEHLEAYAVSTAVGNVRNNGPELIEPLPDAEVSDGKAGSS